MAHDGSIEAGPARAFAALAGVRAAPSQSARADHLAALRAGIKARAEAFAAAIDADFGGRPRQETMLAEIGLALADIDRTQKALGRWMRPVRTALPPEFRPARATVTRVPLGLVGILGPWNYPVQLALVPLVAALAGGNRVIVKPSEHTPRTADLLADLIAGALPPDVARVVTGGAEVARALTALPLDGIFYTGGTETGQRVMAAAAANLVPVTLELGGKSPAIVLPGADLRAAARSLMAGKLFSAGQTCVAPDYVLVPRADTEPLIAALREATRALYPNPDGPDYAAIARPSDRDRLNALLDGQDAVPLMDPMPAAPKLGAYAVRDPSPESPLMRDEIFGPILPVVPYDGPDAAAAFVNARPCPLALYVYGDRDAAARTAAAARSGGAVINDSLIHVAAITLPFGGAGASGMGAYRGEEGFRAFTRSRSVLVQARWSALRLARPPYGRRVDWLIRLLLR